MLRLESQNRQWLARLLLIGGTLACSGQRDSAATVVDTSARKAVSSVAPQGGRVPEAEARLAGVRPETLNGAILAR
jgi:hypothetical protein